MIFPGFPGVLSFFQVFQDLTCSNYDKWIETIQKAENAHFNFRFCIFLRKHLLLIICQSEYCCALIINKNRLNVVCNNSMGTPQLMSNKTFIRNLSVLYRFIVFIGIDS